ncbi:MAG TPA: hypothetical protein VEA81_04585, partial [Burkholderiaceae bacterium]|nr:hypothetical protein [Burkholderiaceae bacterium]
MTRRPVPTADPADTDVSPRAARSPRATTPGAAPSARARRPAVRSDATAAPRARRAGGRSLTDEAYAQLEELIVTMQLAPGSAVSESLLSERLGIGRTP